MDFWKYLFIIVIFEVPSKSPQTFFIISFSLLTCNFKSIKIFIIMILHCSVHFIVRIDNQNYNLILWNVLFLSKFKYLSLSLFFFFLEKNHDFYNWFMLSTWIAYFHMNHFKITASAIWIYGCFHQEAWVAEVD